MIRMELTEQEATILSQTLTSDVSDLRMEIAGTESQPYREQLKGKEVILKQLIQRLGESGIHADQSEPR